MGRIDNERLTLLEYVERYIPHTQNIRVFTGCVSAGPLKRFLMLLPPHSCMHVIAGKFSPDLQREIDHSYSTSPMNDMLTKALNTNRLRLGFHREVHMKVWLLDISIPRKRPQLTIWGSSNLTWQGLAQRKGEQNDRSSGRKRYLLEDARWKKFSSETMWLGQDNWELIKRQCW